MNFFYLKHFIIKNQIQTKLFVNPIVTPINLQNNLLRHKTLYFEGNLIQTFKHFFIAKEN